MARAQQKTQAPAPKHPDFIAYTVQPKGDGEKSMWRSIGAAWLHNDGVGMTLNLEAIPFDRKIVLRAPREQNEQGAR